MLKYIGNSLEDNHTPHHPNNIEGVVVGVVVVGQVAQAGEDAVAVMVAVGVTVTTRTDYVFTC